MSKKASEEIIPSDLISKEIIRLIINETSCDKIEPDQFLMNDAKIILDSCNHNDLLSKRRNWIRDLNEFSMKYLKQVVNDLLSSTNANHRIIFDKSINIKKLIKEQFKLDNFNRYQSVESSKGVTVKILCVYDIYNDRDLISVRALIPITNID